MTQGAAAGPATKKQLIPWTPSVGSPAGGTFVTPLWDGSGPSGSQGVRWVSVPGGQPVEFAMTVFVGLDVTVDLFMSRLVDAGFSIRPSWDWQCELVTRHLEAVRATRIGDVQRLVPDPSGGLVMQQVGRRGHLDQG